MPLAYASGLQDVPPIIGLLEGGQDNPEPIYMSVSSLYFIASCLFLVRPTFWGAKASSGVMTPGDPAGTSCAGRTHEAENWRSSFKRLKS